VPFPQPRKMVLKFYSAFVGTSILLRDMLVDIVSFKRYVISMDVYRQMRSKIWEPFFKVEGKEQNSFFWQTVPKPNPHHKLPSKNTAETGTKKEIDQKTSENAVTDGSDAVNRWPETKEDRKLWTENWTENRGPWTGNHESWTNQET
jgi:hypothetical protein